MYGGIEYNGIVLMTASNRADSGRGHTNGLIAFDEVLTQRDFGLYCVLITISYIVRLPMQKDMTQRF
jgi:hypothetical protein